MQFTAVFLSGLALLLQTTYAAPSSPSTLDVTTFKGQTTGRLIVKLKDDVDKDAHLNWLASRNHSYELSHNWNSTFFNAFAGNISDAALTAIRSSPDVEGIYEDGVMTTQATRTQTNAPWGLARLSQNTRVTGRSVRDLNFAYRFDSRAGQGVDIYVVDTGINTAHTQFNGRARWGKTFGPYASVDGNGHGTHCAGTAASSRFGIAKNANLIAVKVLSDQGPGSVSDIVSGLQFVAQDSARTRRPTVASMSIGGAPSAALDNAVNSLVSRGVHVVVAAGNENQDALNSSPARATGAITVGATTIADTRASFSNFGSAVDIFAPGQDITSTWIGSTNAINTISGTSMATPHVAGLVAYLISIRGNMTPAAMSSLIKSMGTKSVISGLPARTVNTLARNNV